LRAKYPEIPDTKRGNRPGAGLRGWGQRPAGRHAARAAV